MRTTASLPAFGPPAPFLNKGKRPAAATVPPKRDRNGMHETENMRTYHIIKTLRTCALLLLAFAGSTLPLRAVAMTAGSDRFTLVIDAGHGGKDPGAIGRFSREKNINLSVAKAFGQLVERNCPDVKVVYTRKTDVFIPLARRAEIANEAKADLFVSIHTNALPGRAISRGAETYTLGMARADENLEVAKRENSVILVEDDYQERYEGFDPKSAESYIIFELMQDQHMAQSVEFARMVQKEFRTTGGRQDKGVHQAGFLVLRETSMPSVLIELGYISTHDEETFLNSQNGIRKMSQSIYNAFLDYKKAQTKAATDATDSTDAGPETPDTLSTESAAEDMPATDIGQLTQSQDAAPEAATAQRETAPQAAADSRPVFKVQLLASTRQIPAGSARFKALSPVDSYKEGNYYKYTYGATTDYREAVKIRNKVKENFEGAFIVAFKNGQKMELQKAINEYKKNQ